MVHAQRMRMRMRTFYSPTCAWRVYVFSHARVQVEIPQAVAVVYKPAGIHTKSGTHRKHAALEDALTALLSPPVDSTLDALPLPLAMHRLDVPVAGLCLVAKTRSAAVEVARQFADREVHKVYHALLVGVPPENHMRVCEPIDGLPAETTLDVLSVTPHAQWHAVTTVRLMPHTGRTHQLRVHAAGLGCPIVGE